MVERITRPVLLRLPPELVRRIDHLTIDLGEEHPISRNWFVEVLLEDALKRHSPEAIKALLETATLKNAG